MTRTAHVSYGNGAFWVNDVTGSVFLWHLIQAAEKHLEAHAAPWLVETIASWRIAAVITEVASYTDDKWSRDQVDLVLELSRDATSSIRRHGNFSAAEVASWPILEGHQISTRGHDPIPAAAVARLGDAYAMLLEGTLPVAPERHVWFYTLDEAVHTIEMRSS